ncbi:hypothetical protein AB5L52_44085 [Streptomyces sp. CG4]|uniref:hypothetical protein n=1 Tax=Streptomyces sp. CG4 TaxID=408783 RepID=UPI0034E27DA8
MEKRQTVEKVCGYLDGKAPYLCYDTVLAAGWPIATGIFEGACRHLVEDRLDITGGRWGLEGAESVLKLRALIANGDFEPPSPDTSTASTNASTSSANRTNSSSPHDEHALNSNCSRRRSCGRRSRCRD